MTHTNIQKYNELKSEYECTIKVMPAYSGSLQYDQYKHKCSVLADIGSIYLYKAGKTCKPKTKYKLHQYLTIVEKEVQMRERLYPSWKRNGRIDPGDADRYEAIFKDILNDLKSKQQPSTQTNLFPQTSIHGA